MWCSSVILPLVFIVQVNARDVVFQDLMDRLTNKLFDRVVEAQPLHQTNMDSTTLGKPAVATPVAQPFAPASSLGASRQPMLPVAQPFASAPSLIDSRKGMLPQRVGVMPAAMAGGWRPNVRVHAASLQFIKGVDEPNVPEVKLSKSKTGETGQATFIFDQPSIFEDDAKGDDGTGDVTGLYMIDDEGTIQTVDVQARFRNGKPAGIVAKYTMRDEDEWDRFMRFMERYAESNGLGFTKSSKSDRQVV